MLSSVNLIHHGVHYYAAAEGRFERRRWRRAKGDIHLDSQMTNGGHGGQSHPKKGGTKIAQAGARLSASLALGVSGERVIALTSVDRGPQ